VERARGRASAIETVLGWMPEFTDLDWTDSQMTRAEFDPLMHVEARTWINELAQHGEWLEKLGDRLPVQFAFKRELLGLRVTRGEGTQ
jgi:phosphoenolpyruvate carboxykinase (GTP)